MPTNFLYVFFACILSFNACADALIKPSHQSLTVSPGDQISIQALVSDITDLYAFQFDWVFNPIFLRADSVTEGDLLPTAGQSYFFGGVIDNVGGTISATSDLLLGAVDGVNGTGMLATASFTALMGGITTIELDNQILLNSKLDLISSPTPEPSTLILGLFGLTFVAMKRLQGSWSHHEA